MGNRLSVTQTFAAVNLVIAGPMLVIIGAQAVADQRALGVLMICLGVLVFVLAVYRLLVNERLSKEDRTRR